jgi:Tol biopolymer transport system component
VDGFSISRDGRRVVLAAADRRTALQEVGFDPEAGALGGTPRTILRGSRFIDWLDWSPDGREIVFGTLGATREELYVIGADGAGYRQLTEDGHRNRAPRWSPDGKSIAFMSDRNGDWENWSIRPDGGGLRELVRYSGIPTWSPDGRTLAISGASEGAVLTRPSLNVELVRIPPIGGGRRFYPVGWSPDGRSIVGVAAHLTFEAGEIYSYLVDRGEFRDLEVFGSNPAWLPDGERLLYSVNRKLLLLDARRGAVRELLPRGSVPGGIWQKFALSSDGRHLAYLEPYEEGDLWMMAIGAGGPGSSTPSGR